MTYAAPPHWQHPALRRASRLALRAPSAPALRTCLLARLPSPSGLVSAATTCPRPAEVVGRGTWYREATALVAGFSPARWRRPGARDKRVGARLHDPRCLTPFG